ncbi:MAG: hypothetical protein L0J48_00355 [Alkalibacterium sp.]|nr:hypothetical protein [Alkalibacterium sp.]MDN6423791.1 hypothetical protein [Tetragenococcus koreensis]
MLDNFRKIDLVWNNAYEKLKNARTAQFDEKGRKLVVQVTDDGDIVDLTGVELRLVTIDGIEVGGRNLLRNSNFAVDDRSFWEETGSADFDIINFPYHSGGHSIRLIGNSSGTRNFYSYLPAKEGDTYSLSFYAYLTGNDFRPFATYIRLVYLDENEVILKEQRFTLSDFLNLSTEEWHRTTVEGVKAPENTVYVSAHIRWWLVNDEIFIDEIKLEKDTKATDWTPAPEDLQFPFDLIDAQKGIYELYFPKFFVDRYTGKTKVFLELTTKDFSVTSEPFYTNVFEGVK